MSEYIQAVFATLKNIPKKVVIEGYIVGKSS